MELFDREKLEGINKGINNLTAITIKDSEELRESITSIINDEIDIFSTSLQSLGKKVSRKRLIKLMMANGYGKNEAKERAKEHLDCFGYYFVMESK